MGAGHGHVLCRYAADRSIGRARIPTNASPKAPSVRLSAGERNHTGAGRLARPSPPLP